MFYNACLQSSPRGVLSPPLLHNISQLDITHLYLLACLAHLVVVVDGEHPQTPGVLLVRVLPHASLPPGRITVCSYHRLGRVGRLEIIGHRPGHMVHVVCQLPQSSPHPLLAHPLLGQLETASPAQPETVKTEI